MYYSICVYCPLSLDINSHLHELETYTDFYKDHKMIIYRDFNVKNDLWRRNRANNRGYEVIDFIVRNNLSILNNPHSVPNYCSTTNPFG